MTQDNPDLGEQALSKVVEVGLASQLDPVDNLKVDIRTDPLKTVLRNFASTHRGSNPNFQRAAGCDSLNRRRPTCVE